MLGIEELMVKHGSDKAEWGHGYSRWYEKHIGYLKNSKFTLIELGIGGEDSELGGKSLLAWRDYFKHADIAGLDIYNKKELEKYDLEIFQGSQTDIKIAQEIVKKMGNPHILIDDASHICKNTIESFKLWFPLVECGGWYIIEDISTSYRWDFGGSKVINDMSLETTMNFLFLGLHELMPIELGNCEYKRSGWFEEVESIQFYNDIVFIKKK